MVALSDRNGTEAAARLEAKADAKRQDLVSKLKVSPYRYSRYAEVVGALSEEELALGGSEVDKTPDRVRELAVGTLASSAERYVSAGELALRYAKLVNRAFFLEDEILSGRYFTTMGMKSQVVDLALLLPSLRALRPASGGAGAGLRVLFAGCGLGDWAAETALFVGGASTVWCWNYGTFSAALGSRIFRGNAVEDVFDLGAMDGPQREAARAIHEGKGLVYVCSERGKENCQGQSQGGLLTTQVAETVDAFAGGRRYDAIVYGNSLMPGELQSVRDALQSDASFALVPVCLNVWASHDASAAAWYCEGVYWKIGKRHDEGPLVPFPGVMRPLGTEADSAAGATRGAEGFAPAGWKPSK